MDEWMDRVEIRKKKHRIGVVVSLQIRCHQILPSLYIYMHAATDIKVGYNSHPLYSGWDNMTYLINVPWQK